MIFIKTKFYQVLLYNSKIYIGAVVSSVSSLWTRIAEWNQTLL